MTRNTNCQESADANESVEVLRARNRRGKVERYAGLDEVLRQQHDDSVDAGDEKHPLREPGSEVHGHSLYRCITENHRPVPEHPRVQ